MKIQYCDNNKQMSYLAADSIVSDLKLRSKQLICAATGNSPIGIYTKLEEFYQDHPDYFIDLSIIKLDEWGGLKNNDVNSCETYIRNKILQPLHISDNRYISFNGEELMAKKECERVQKEIDTRGPIDICILGLGKNGHIGLNEPEEFITPGCHIAQLSQTSQQHEMTNNMVKKPIYGYTLGMRDILLSKKIILLITGPAKEEIIKQFLTKKITSQLPVSFLWLHSNVECYIDSESL